MKAKEVYSCEYAVLPSEITPENMFDGWQHYQTTEHILGITANPESWEKVRISDYNNPIFKGTLAYQDNQFYGSILTYAKIDGKEYYACNGICEPERSTQILDLYKKTKEFSGKQYIGRYEIEKYMLTEILRLRKNNQ